MLMQRRSNEQVHTGERPRYRVNLPEPAENRTALLEEINKLQKSKKNRWLRRVVILLLVLGLLIAGGWYGLRYYQKRQLVNQIPLSIRQSVSFKLVYPTQNKLNPDSVQYVGGVVSYTVNVHENVMYVTLQSSPENFDFTSFAKQINQPTSIRTPLGKATLGSLSNRQIGSLKTDDCWVLITATQDTPQSDIEAILQQLKKV